MPELYLSIARRPPIYRRDELRSTLIAKYVKLLGMEQAFKYRFYPTLEQENLLRRTIGCTRLVYNRALHTRTEAWTQRQEKINYLKTSKLLTQWKQEEDLQFLNDVSAVPLQQCLRHLEKAFGNFWAGRARYPRFKRKRSEGSAEFTKSAFRWQDGELWLAKTKAPLNIIWSRALPVDCEPSTITVRQLCSFQLNVA